MTSKTSSFATIKLIVSAIVLVAVFSTLIVLGTWQMNRLEWKENLLANIQARSSSVPIPIDDVIKAYASGQDFEYQQVKVFGTFDHSKERHFFATHNGFSGYYVYTPLSFDGGIVFINRGFVPFDYKDQATRQQGQVEGQVEIIGLARAMLDQKPSSIVPDNEPDANKFFWKDLSVMAQSSGLIFEDPNLMKFFIDANDAPNQGGFPQGGVTIIDLPNSHLQYAFTWYGLAGTLLCIVAIFLFRRKTVKA